MAEQINGAEFRLPPKFLTDEYTVMERAKLNNKHSGNNNNTESLLSSYSFPSEFPYEFVSFDSSSPLSSPVDSVVESTETDSSDEDEFLAGLNRRLAFSTTQKLTVPSFTWDKTEKTGVSASSPQSTLSELGSWSASSNGSPNGSSHVPSPSTTPFGAQNDTWDLIYAAASQVARLKLNNEPHNKFTNINHGTVLHKTQNHSFMNNSSSGLCSSQRLAYNLAQTNQSQIRQMQQQINCRARLQPQQPQHSCGSCMMRPIFNGGSKRGSAGTGVFIPRTYSNNSHVSNKKPGGSAVIVPTNVVQALNLNFDDSNTHVQPHFNASFAPNYDALFARRNALLRQRMVNYRQEGGLNLPHEWSY